jgi:Fe2+ or Zn2+ uptake regulation protein
MAMAELLQQDRRLVVLRVLNESVGYTANESILDQALEAYGHLISRDTVKADMFWLEEQALVSLKDMNGTLVATIKQRGIDVAKGQASHPGVKRPSPE